MVIAPAIGEHVTSERNTFRLFDVDIDVVTMRESVDRLISWLDAPFSECRYAVTPNVDHVVMLRNNREFQDIYRDAHLVLADGCPLILASRLLGKPLPERVAGSELVPKLLSAIPADRQLSCFLLGAAPGVADRATQHIHECWPSVQVNGTYSPPLGFEHDDQECERILSRIADVQPELTIVGLGAPKQELWVHRHQTLLASKVALCVGATIDFLAGEKVQAPVWMRRWGLEWTHRLASEPRRLFGRYAKDAWIFPQLVWK